MTSNGKSESNRESEPANSLESVLESVLVPANSLESEPVCRRCHVNHTRVFFQVRSCFARAESLFGHW